MFKFRKYASRAGIAISFSISLFTPSAWADVTNWVDLGGGRARMVSVFNPASGEIEGIVDVELLPGWTTYWRNPGEAGIPPDFNFSTSTGVAVDKPEFPVPITKVTSGIVTVGYKNHVAFPFKARPLTSPMSGEIKLDILLGVCEAICIPAVASFKQELTKLNQSDPISSAMIEEAKRRVPIKNASQTEGLAIGPANGLAIGPANGLAIGRVSALAEGQADGLAILEAKRQNETIVVIRARVPITSNNPQLYAEGKRSWFFSPAKVLKREGEIVHFALALDDLPADADLSKTPIRFTLAADNVGSEHIIVVDK